MGSKRRRLILHFETKIKIHSQKITDIINRNSNPPVDWAEIADDEDYGIWSDHPTRVFELDFESDEDDALGNESEGQKPSDSDWYSDWKERLEYFLGHRPDQVEEQHYRHLFGGDNECRFNLVMYASRIKNGRACIHAKADDYYRPRYETLAKTGAMLTGEDIAPHNRLLALSMNQLRQLGIALAVPKKKSKVELLEQFQNCEAGLIEKNWALTEIDVNDLFWADIGLLDQAQVK